MILMRDQLDLVIKDDSDTMTTLLGRRPGGGSGLPSGGTFHDGIESVGDTLE